MVVLQRIVQISVTMILLGVLAIAGVIHVFLAGGESYSCPAGEESTLDYGGWFEPSFCRNSRGGTVAVAEQGELNLLQPWWSVAGLTVVGIAVGIGIVLAWRRPASRRRIQYEPERPPALPT